MIGALAGGGCPGRRWLLMGLTAAWGLRLGAHLAARRRREPGEDRRYTALRERRGAAFVRWSAVGVFGLQGILILVVSLPIQVAAAQGGRAFPWAVPGCLVFAVGLAFEAVGDEQLRRFRPTRPTPGAVLDRGLWRYTRHPNYFGDVCVWWGLWLVALTASGTWWTAVGPLAMTGVLIRVSGKTLLERDIAARRPGYGEYVERTSGFLPRPPRRIWRDGCQEGNVDFSLSRWLGRGCGRLGGWRSAGCARRAVRLIYAGWDRRTMVRRGEPLSRIERGQRAGRWLLIAPSRIPRACRAATDPADGIGTVSDLVATRSG